MTSLWQEVTFFTLGGSWVSGPVTYAQAGNEQGPIIISGGLAGAIEVIMRNRGLYAAIILSGMLVISAGCDNRQIRPTTRSVRTVAPPGISETVAGYADLVGGDAMLVRGPGVVVGLGDAGSSEVPNHLRKYLIQQMGTYRVGSHLAGTVNVTPARILADKDTAVVVVSGFIPPAAPVGTRFDVHVESLPRTQTLSLDGGILMTTDMHMSMITSIGSAARSKTLASSRGAVFVNPFLDRTKEGAQARLRVGRIPNGGVVARSRPIRLELRRADYRVSRLIQRLLNERFGEGQKVAVAKTPSIIELHIPRSYRDNYIHFLQLVMHTYVSGSTGGEEKYARRLAKDILLPTARHEDIALVWEAAGRQILPIIRELYASSDPAAAFYSARTGMRLNDTMAADVIIHIANRADSPFQIQAVEELGRATRSSRGLATLKRMLSSNNELLRVSAYEALIKHGSRDLICRRDISGQFVVDEVKMEGDYAIYATVSGQPKIVLFGNAIPLNRPLFYCPDDEMVTIDASRSDKKVMIYRRVPGTQRQSDPFYVVPRVDEFIRTLGSRPSRGADGNIEGLGLTYSQVVGVLYGLCKNEHIPAKFVLQRSDALRRIYTSVPAAGRSDMPED
ncbi:MAG: flagellar basal body P-ring protein FlgI [Phycisphaerae bacterium]|nr:flagellar basal body P-ring protein FlgI [Phycisphaerae bacterium]